MPLKPLEPLEVLKREWKQLNDTNNKCPGCNQLIYKYNRDIEYSRTKRKTTIFWHTGCTGKVWG